MLIEQIGMKKEEEEEVKIHWGLLCQDSIRNYRQIVTFCQRQSIYFAQFLRCLLLLSTHNLYKAARCCCCVLTKSTKSQSPDTTMKLMLERKFHVIFPFPVEKPTKIEWLCWTETQCFHVIWNQNQTTFRSTQ